tara:strand:- start:400 stop:531 length:132 start_codon:yes stop_codon:yes gene_type:complete
MMTFSSKALTNQALILSAASHIHQHASTAELILGHRRVSDIAC